MRPRSLTALVCVLLLSAATWVVASPYSDSVLSQTSPVFYWNLDGNATDLAPGPGGANNGIPTFQAAWGRPGPRPSEFASMDPNNGAIRLDGQNDTVIYDRALNGFDNAGGAGIGTSAYSVQAWFNSSAGFTDRVHSYVFGRGDFQNLSNYFGDSKDSVGVGGNWNPALSNKLFFFDGDAGSGTVVGGSTHLQPNTWHHTVFVRDNNEIKVFLNGQPEIAATVPWAGGDGDVMAFGGRADYVNVGHLNLDGRVDEVAAWNRALSNAEVQSLYQAAAPVPLTQTSDYPARVLADSPAAYWRLNETAPYPTAHDLSGNGKDQPYMPSPTRTGVEPDVGPRPNRWPGFETANNAPTTSSSISSFFDGYVVAPGGGGSPTVHVPDDDYSVEFMVRPSALTGYAVGYLSHRRDFDGSSGFGDGLGMIGDYTALPVGRGQLFFTVGSDATLMGGPTALQAGTWYHVAMVRDGGDVSVYLNGELEMSGAYPTPPPGTFDQGTWVFGGRSDLTFLKWPGNMDEIAIHGKALDASEVRSHYFAATGWDEMAAPYPQAVLSDAPAAYWRLNETEPYTRAADLTNNGHGMAYHLTPIRTGTGADVGPRGPVFPGFEAHNNAPLLTGGPEIPRPGGLTDGYVGIADGVLPGENDYSVEMWFRRGAVGSIGTYLMHRNDLDAAGNTGDFLGLGQGDQPGEINLFIYNGGWPLEPSGAGLLFPGESDVLEDEWYHVGMVREGDEVSVYLNAVLEIGATMPLLPGTKWTDGTWAFGGRTDFPQLDQKFAGNLDEIALYRGALDPLIFRQHYLVAIVPEPGTCLLVGGGLLALLRRRRRRS